VELITPLDINVPDTIEVSDVVTDISTGIANDLTIFQTEWSEVLDLATIEIDPFEISLQDSY